MKKISADIIFPITSNPITNGTIVVDDNGKVLELLNEKHNDSIHYSGAIIPGFINTHCHLELSYLKKTMPEQTGLDVFIRDIERKRKSFTQQDILQAIEKADVEMKENGIVAVGDISNDNFSFEVKKRSNIYYHTFIEVLGFHPDRAETAFEKAKTLYSELNGLNASITPHAPYSASEKLLKKVADHASNTNGIITIHNQENADEDVMFKSGTGKIVERLQSFGIDTGHFKPTGVSSMQSTLPFLLKAKKILLVHNTFTSLLDLEWLKHYVGDKVFLCLCPNANLYIENTLPDVEMLFNSSLPLTIGTDSLASNHQLSIWAEVRTLLNRFPKLKFEEVLTWATLNGAKYLGVDDLFGSIEKNKTPGLINIRGFKNNGINSIDNFLVKRII